ncbi:MAG: hypothetical protein HZB34_03780 [Nitrospirae bacterium]|nr:hypothetical protein [Nitrospirota bacterium]
MSRLRSSNIRAALVNASLKRDGRDRREKHDRQGQGSHVALVTPFPLTLPLTSSYHQLSALSRAFTIHH